jgi:hypothetical protein
VPALAGSRFFSSSLEKTLEKIRSPGTTKSRRLPSRHFNPPPLFDDAAPSLATPESDALPWARRRCFSRSFDPEKSRRKAGQKIPRASLPAFEPKATLCMFPRRAEEIKKYLVASPDKNKNETFL